MPTPQEELMLKKLRLALGVEPEPMSTPIDPELARAQEGANAVDTAQQVPLERNPAQADARQEVAQQAMRRPQAPPSPMEQYQMQMAQAAQEKERLTKPLLDAQERGIQDIESGIQDLQNKPAKLNLQALLAQHDSSFGTNLGKGYVAPPSEEERAKTILALKEKLQSSRGELTSKQIQALNDRMLGKGYEAQARQSRYEGGLFKDFIKDTEKNVNKLQTSYSSTSSELDRINNIVDRGNVREVKQAISSLARTVGQEKGALAEGDVKRAFYEDLFMRLNGLEASIDPDAKYDEKSLRAVKNGIAEAKNAATRTYAGTLNALKKTGQLRAEAQGMGDKMAPGQPAYQIYESAMELAKPQAEILGNGPRAQQGTATPKEVVGKDGRTYVLNPETGKYRAK